MASSSDAGRDRNQSFTSCPGSGAKHDRAGDVEENPFLAFRQYADRQLSTILQSIVGLPSAVLSPPAKNWLSLIDQELAEALQMRRETPDNQCCRHNCHHESESNYDTPRHRPGYDERLYGASRSEGRSSDCEQRPKRPSYSLPVSAFDALVDSPWPTDPSTLFWDLAHLHKPFIFDFMAPSTSAGWPLPYLMFSPYSPLQLERQQQLRQRNSSSWLGSRALSHEASYPREPCWRDAFEDLLRIENGKPMVDRVSLVRGKQEPAKDWLLGLIQRGSLGEGWSHVRLPGGDADYFKFFQAASNDGFPEKTQGPQGSPESDGNLPFSELDLYDNFLHKVNDGQDDDERSPLIKAVLEGRKRHRQELEELQYQWKEMFREHEIDRMDGHQRICDESNSQHPLLFSQPNQDEALSQSIVSSITTTRRLTQPDGSVKTKTIVKRRFGDGREENFETEEISENNQSSVMDNNQMTACGSNVPEVSNSINRKQGGGWFWQD